MLSDRRVITENEIFMLINWKLERFCIDNKTDTMKILVDGNPIIEIKAKGFLLDKIKKEIEEDKQ